MVARIRRHMSEGRISPASNFTDDIFVFRMASWQSQQIATFEEELMVAASIMHTRFEGQ